MLLSITEAHKSYVDKMLLNNVSLYIDKKDKIGIIGLNGSGKSTLLKILAGKIEADKGELFKAPLLKIGYLSQNLELNEELTIIEQVFNDISKDIKDLKMYEAKAILTKLGLSDFDRVVKTLSGGEKRILSLACVLIRPSDVLILDEPTNHLDSDIIEWLEKYLIKYSGAIIMVTHDRYFLERVVNKICELDNGNLFSYEANYSKFLELKAQREEYEIAAYRKKKALLKKELVWIMQGAQARETKSKNRIENYEKLKEETKIGVKKSIEVKTISSRLGGKTIELNNISKSYDKLLFKNFTLNLDNDARIGIVGKNGVGKSTLFNIIMGKVSSDSGSVDIGETVRIGYFSQENEGMDLNKRVIDYIKDISEFIKTNDGEISASKMLEHFLFEGSIQYSPISKLSGGERRRLHLLGVLMSSPNILLLDEPTNDLDIETLSILEDYLDDFKGAVLVISHDRYFLDRVVDSIYALEDQEFNQYNGGYSDYFEKRKEIDTKIIESKKDSQEKPKQTKVKLTYQEEKEFSTIEDKITLLEEEIDTLNNEININAHNYELLKPLLEKKQSLDQELDEAMNRWEFLSNKFDKMQNN